MKRICVTLFRTVCLTAGLMACQTPTDTTVGSSQPVVETPLTMESRLAAPNGVVYTATLAILEETGFVILSKDKDAGLVTARFFEPQENHGIWGAERVITDATVTVKSDGPQQSIVTYRVVRNRHILGFMGSVASIEPLDVPPMTTEAFFDGLQRRVATQVGQ